MYEEWFFRCKNEGFVVYMDYKLFTYNFL
jgi:hypothetical protein